MTDILNQIQQRIDNGFAPTEMAVTVTEEFEPAVEVWFDEPRRTVFLLRLAEAERVTGDGDALVDSTPCLLVELAKTKGGTLSGGVFLRFVSEVDRDREESAAYTVVSEGHRPFETAHPDHHMTTDPDGNYEYFLFER